MVYSYYMDDYLIWVIDYKTPFFRDSIGWNDGLGATYRNVDRGFYDELDGADRGEYCYVYNFKNKEWIKVSASIYVDRGFYLADWINVEYDGGRKLIPDSTQIIKYGWSSAQKDTLRERLKSAREFIKTHNTDFPFEDVIDDTIRFQGDVFY